MGEKCHILKTTDLFIVADSFILGFSVAYYFQLGRPSI